MNRTAQPSLLCVHDAIRPPLARLWNLSPLSFHPTHVHHCTRLSRPATPCGALPLVQLCICFGAVGCQVAVTYSPFSVADGPRRVPRAVSEYPEIHVSVATFLASCLCLWKVRDSNPRHTSRFQYCLTLSVPFLSANPPNVSYPDYSCLRKPANFTAGWIVFYNMFNYV